MQTGASAPCAATCEHILETRYHGGRCGMLEDFLDDFSEDNTELIRVRNTDQVKPVMDAMIERWAEIHVHPDIRLSGPDAPRNMMLATYGGISTLDHTIFSLPHQQEDPVLGTSGVIVTQQNRVTFCQRERSFPIIDGMCFWGWMGMKFRVAWRQHNGILKDTAAQWALPHDASKEARASWTEIEDRHNSHSDPSRPNCQQPHITPPHSTSGAIDITAANIWATPCMFESRQAVKIQWSPQQIGLWSLEFEPCKAQYTLEEAQKYYRCR